MKVNQLRVFLWGGLIVAGFVLAACQGGGEPETLEERAQARWDLLVERDFAPAWEYYPPGFRQTTEREQFVHEMSRRPIRWLDAEVLGTDCQEARCSVSVRVTYRAVTAPHGQSRMEMTREIDEQWLRVDGQWWYSPE